MNFKQKLAASVLLPLTLFLLALLVSIWGQIRIEDRFASYLKSEAAAKQLHAMYAQGLQMGSSPAQHRTQPG
jgi:CHASE3 domain sensor protein